MGKNAVDYNSDTPLFRRLYKGYKILLAAEQRVGFQIIRRVVAVVRVRLENRVQINTADAEFLKIGELLLYTFEIAAVVIVAETLFVSGLPVFGLRVPVAAQKAVVRYAIFFFSGAVKTVGENLIYYSSVKPVGRFEITLKYRKLPPFSLLSRNNAERMVRLYDVEIAVVTRISELIPEKPLCKGYLTFVKAVAIKTSALGHTLLLYDSGAVGFYHEKSRVNMSVVMQQQLKPKGIPFG